MIIQLKGKYSVSRCKAKTDELWGNIHASNDGNFTLCRLEIKPKLWWIISNRSYDQVTCKKCLNELTREFRMNWSTLDKYEQIVYKWQYQLMGGFFTNLMNCISLADGENLELLRKSYPDHVKAYELYTTEEGWWTAVVAKTMIDDINTKLDDIKK